MGKWENNINREIAQADDSVRAMKAWLNDNQKRRNALEREEKLEFEVRLHETKLKMQAELKQNAKQSSQTSSEATPYVSENMIGTQAKLPKLSRNLPLRTQTGPDFGDLSKRTLTKPLSLQS